MNDQSPVEVKFSPCAICTFPTNESRVGVALCHEHAAWWDSEWHHCNDVYEVVEIRYNPIPGEDHERIVIFTGARRHAEQFYYRMWMENITDADAKMIECGRFDIDTIAEFYIVKFDYGSFPAIWEIRKAKIETQKA